MPEYRGKKVTLNKPRRIAKGSHLMLEKSLKYLLKTTMII